MIKKRSYEPRDAFRKRREKRETKGDLTESLQRPETTVVYSDERVPAMDS